MLEDIIDIIWGLLSAFVITIIIGVMGILASVISISIVLKILEMF